MTVEISRPDLEALIAANALDERTFRATAMETVEAYYEAEEAAEATIDDFDFDGPTDPADVPAYFARALESAGYEPEPGPVILWDVEDDSRWFGNVDDHGIHLHRRMLRPMGLLHELAHWIDPRGGHSSRWAHIYLELVTHMLGREAAAALRSEFEARELPHDW